MFDVKQTHSKIRQMFFFVGYPTETIEYYFYNKKEGKVFFARNDVFLEKEFLSKEVSGRKM
jgi:hypothetical protein